MESVKPLSREPPAEPSIEPSEKSAPSKQRVPQSCMKAFDSIYFCYSPVHQFRQYYITGELDDCRARLKRFRMCVMSRFRPQQDSEIIYQAEEEKEIKAAGMEHVKPVWEFREEYLESVADAEREEKDKDIADQKDGEAWWL